VYNSASYISAATGSFAVPLTATPGNTRMRVVADDLSTSPVACPGNSYTECEDYTFNVIAQVPCLGTPNAGTATISSSSGCSGTGFTLSSAGLTTGGGISYQWQTSADGISGWTNIGGATSTSLSTSTLTTAYYRLLTSCSNSGLSNNTNIVSYTALGCTNTNVPATGSNNVLCGTNTNLYDAGGSGADYSASSSGYTVLENSGTGVITISGSFTAIETCCDHLNFYSGIGTGGTLLATYNGTGTITPIISAAGIPITVQFTSDGSIQGAGFALQVAYSGTCVACTAPPSGGIAAATPNPICPGLIVTLSVSGATLGSGLTYQWQSSPDNVTWTNIAGATNSGYVVNPISTTWYRRIITCSGISANSTPIQVVVSMTYACYCSSTATSTFDEDILNVTFGSLNNSSTCSTTGGTGSVLNLYSNFTGIAAPVVMQTQVVPFSVQVGTCGSNYSNGVGIWIDYNQDGDLTDPGEFVYSSTVTTVGPHTESGNITIPLTSTLGTTLMRVIVTELSVPSSPCGTYSYGETEDYYINIISATPCSGTPVAGSASASPQSICLGSSTTLSVSGFSSVSGLTFQWESSPNNVVWTAIAGATSLSYLATPGSNMYYRCKVTCSNSLLSSYSVYTYVTITSPPNDLPCNAQNMLIADLTPGDNSCATGTGEPAVPSCWTTGNLNTVWYKFTTSAGQTSIKIKTIVGSLLNTQIALFSGSCGPTLTMVACNNDVTPCGSSYYYNSELAATVAPLTTYYIAVDGANDLTGTFSIVWVDGATEWPPVPGQDCISDVPVCAATFTVGNPGYQAVGNICDFPGGGTNCLLSGERGSAWYEIKITAAGNMMFTIEPNDVMPATANATLTSYGTDYDFAIWKKSGTGAVTCADIAAGAVPLRCNYSPIGVTGLYTGGVTPTIQNTYTSHYYSSGSYDGAFEDVLPVQAGESYWLVISNFSNSLSGFAINFLNSTNTFDFSIPNPLIWTGGASSTNWFDSRNWGNCLVIPDTTRNCIVAASSFYQPVINAIGAKCRSITINPGASLTINNGFNLDVAGNYNNQGSFNAVPGSTVTLVGGATQTLDGIMVTPHEFFNLVSNRLANTTTTNQHIECDGSFTTSNIKSIMNMNSNNLTVGGNFTNFSGNTTFIPGSGTLFFDGSGSQTYTNSNGVLTLNNVTMIHSGNGVTLANNMNLGPLGVLT
ncbi:MAG: GEVED domain-containing protein, partial [Bacteroidota bacterium]